MEHFMNLHPSPFAMIKSGQKSIELRLNDEKRKSIAVGDCIIFQNTETGERLRTEAVALHKFSSFAELYSRLPLLKCGYTAANVHSASPADMNEYYSAEEQSRYGVVGIQIKLIAFTN